MRGFLRIEELNLNPSVFVPFQNAKLTEDQYIIIKDKMINEKGREQEELKIESFVDPTAYTRPRP